MCKRHDSADTFDSFIRSNASNARESERSGDIELQLQNAIAKCNVYTCNVSQRNLRPIGGPAHGDPSEVIFGSKIAAVERAAHLTWSHVFTQDSLVLVGVRARAS